MKKFSIIIPAYSAKPLIAQTLDSVLQQTVTDFEVIVVNDGSTDQTATIVE
jgi:glycosyltransferase involved in cell wall biosynthesis